MKGYGFSFKDTKYISFVIKNNQLLEKYNKNWSKLSNIMGKAFPNSLVIEKKYL